MERMFGVDAGWTSVPIVEYSRIEWSEPAEATEPPGIILGDASSLS
jgi:hypothetical protein